MHLVLLALLEENGNIDIINMNYEPLSINKTETGSCSENQSISSMMFEKHICTRYFLIAGPDRGVI